MLDDKLANLIAAKSRGAVRPVKPIKMKLGDLITAQKTTPIPQSADEAMALQKAADFADFDPSTVNMDKVNTMLELYSQDWDELNPLSGKGDPALWNADDVAEMLNLEEAYGNQLLKPFKAQMSWNQEALTDQALAEAKSLGTQFDPNAINPRTGLPYPAPTEEMTWRQAQDSQWPLQLFSQQLKAEGGDKVDAAGDPIPKNYPDPDPEAVNRYAHGGPEFVEKPVYLGLNKPSRQGMLDFEGAPNMNAAPEVKWVGPHPFDYEVTGYHTGTDPNLTAEDVRPGFHYGSLRSALDRARQTRSGNLEGDEYLYRVKARGRFVGAKRPVRDFPANQLTYLENDGRFLRAGYDTSMKQSHITDTGGRYLPPTPEQIERIGRTGVPSGLTRAGTDAALYNNYAEHAGVPSAVVYEPSIITGLERIYGGVGNAKNLYNLLAAFVPQYLPQIQTPADWVINHLMLTGESSPWNPENQMGYTVPA